MKYLEFSSLKIDMERGFPSRPAPNRPDDNCDTRNNNNCQVLNESDDDDIYENDKIPVVRETAGNIYTNDGRNECNAAVHPPISNATDFVVAFSSTNSNVYQRRKER